MAKKLDADLAIEQIDATWEAARQSGQLLKVGIISAFINSLVVVTALIVPIYQKSLETIDQDQDGRAQAYIQIEKSIQIYKKSQSEFGEEFEFIMPMCLGSSKNAADQLVVLSKSLSNDSNMMYQVTTKFPFMAGYFTEEADIADTLEYLRGHNLRNSGRHINDPQISINCSILLSDYFGENRMLLSNALDVYRIYMKPIQRPFWIFDGPEIKITPIEISDKSGRFLNVDIYLNREIDRLASKLKTHSFLR
jgi:hypothetical protein